MFQISYVRARIVVFQPIYNVNSLMQKRPRMQNRLHEPIFALIMAQISHMSGIWQKAVNSVTENPQ